MGNGRCPPPGSWCRETLLYAIGVGRSKIRVGGDQSKKFNFRMTEPDDLDQATDQSEKEDDICGESNSCSGSNELEVGAKVASEDEAYYLYNIYALHKGFSIRKRNRRVVGGVLRQREFVCSKEGEMRFNSDERNHLATRTNCLARVRFTITDGDWEVTHFNDAHNHEFATQEEKRNLRSGRKVRDSHADVVTSTDLAGIKPTKSCLEKQVGGVHTVAFTKKDCCNFLSTIKQDMIEGLKQGMYKVY